MQTNSGYYYTFLRDFIDSGFNSQIESKKEYPGRHLGKDDKDPI